MRSLLLVALIPVVAVWLALLAREHRNAKENFVEQVSLATRLSANSLNEYLASHLAGVTLLAEMSTMDRDWHACPLVFAAGAPFPGR
ncbi:MAG TPA: hypothetical protein VK325_07435 [Pseudoxanthomonas sp.]|nr:hypothetical protein [Pseudoxanthomonas sp.]